MRLRTFLSLFALQGAVLCAGCSKNQAMTELQQHAHARWEQTFHEAEREEENLALLERQIFNEGPRSRLLDRYEANVSSLEEILMNAVFAAEQIAFIGGKDSLKPLAESLADYTRITEKSRFVANRFQRKGLALKADEMAQTIQDICQSIGSSGMRIPACKTFASK